jgi:hypothetical protein
MQRQKDGRARSSPGSANLSHPHAGPSGNRFIFGVLLRGAVWPPSCTRNRLDEAESRAGHGTGTVLTVGCQRRQQKRAVARWIFKQGAGILRCNWPLDSPVQSLPIYLARTNGFCRKEFERRDSSECQRACCSDGIWQNRCFLECHFRCFGTSWISKTLGHSLPVTNKRFLSAS